jgi:hypothetical protein
MQGKKHAQLKAQITACVKMETGYFFETLASPNRHGVTTQKNDVAIFIPVAFSEVYF